MKVGRHFEDILEDNWTKFGITNMEEIWRKHWRTTNLVFLSTPIYFLCLLHAVAPYRKVHLGRLDNSTWRYPGPTYRYVGLLLPPPPPPPDNYDPDEEEKEEEEGGGGGGAPRGFPAGPRVPRVPRGFPAGTPTRGYPRRRRRRRRRRRWRPSRSAGPQAARGYLSPSRCGCGLRHPPRLMQPEKKNMCFLWTFEDPTNSL